MAAFAKRNSAIWLGPLTIPMTHRCQPNPITNMVNEGEGLSSRSPGRADMRCHTPSPVAPPHIPDFVPKPLPDIVPHIPDIVPKLPDIVRPELPDWLLP